MLKNIFRKQRKTSLLELIFLPPLKMCGVAPWCASADAREPPPHIFSARERTRVKFSRQNTTYGLPIVAAVVAPTHIDRMEVEADGAVRIVRIERTRPIVAARPCVAQITIAAIASSRKEDGVTIGACYGIATSCPSPFAFLF